MLDGARKRLSANPHDVLRNLAGLKSGSPVGSIIKVQFADGHVLSAVNENPNAGAPAAQ